MTRDEALAALKAAGVADPAGDLRRLERAADDHSPGWLVQAVEKRARRMPMSHILGFRDFWKHRFSVTPDVLDPRPETETLVEVALQEPFEKVLDLGVGSGAILVSLLGEQAKATGVGTDISEAGILVAGANAESAGVADRLLLVLSDWWDDVGGTYDLIVSNPPYIAADEMLGLSPEVRAHEPRIALTDGADGLTAYGIIAEQAANFLRPGGRILLEIGPTQAHAVRQLLTIGGLDPIGVYKDLDGRDRVIGARKQSNTRP